VRSSTSSSEPRRWGRIWVIGPAAALCVLLTLEVWVRAHGHRPGVASERDLWCHHRKRVVGADLRSIALLGSSRMQSGLVQTAFREALPGVKPVQLALAGTSPVAVLKDLARDQTFRGVVVCEVFAQFLQPGQLRGQEHAVQYCEDQWGPGKEVELWLKLPFEQRLALLQPALTARLLATSLQRGKAPAPPTSWVLEDRTRVMSYVGDQEDAVAARMRRNRKNAKATAVSWSADVGRIQARGGRVVFVHFPISGRYRALDESVYPRARHWDVLAAHVGAPAIHYTEMKGYDTLVLPDESHLDLPSAGRFTRWLAEELVARGIVDR
jgi:hypothetical protein